MYRRFAIITCLMTSHFFCTASSFADVLTPPYIGAWFDHQVLEHDGHVGVGAVGTRHPNPLPIDPEAGLMQHNAMAVTHAAIIHGRRGVDVVDRIMIPFSVENSGNYTIEVQGHFDAEVISFGGGILSFDAATVFSRLFTFVSSGHENDAELYLAIYDENTPTALLDAASWQLYTETLGQFTDGVIPISTLLSLISDLGEIFSPVFEIQDQFFVLYLDANLNADVLNYLTVGVDTDCRSEITTILGGHAAEVCVNLRIEQINLQPSGNVGTCEPNDSELTPCWLGGLTEHYSLSDLSIGAGDHDWYQFSTIQTASASDSVSISFSQAHGDLDMCVYERIGVNPLDLRPIPCSESATDNETITLEGQPAGTYYIEVYGNNGATNFDYVLNISPPTENRQFGDFILIDDIDWDDNGPDYDNSPECGESVKAQIRLCSAFDVNFVRGILLGSNNVQIYDAEEYYGTIDAQVCKITGGFDMIVNPCSNTSLASFSLILEYEKGGILYRQVIFFDHRFPEVVQPSFEVCEVTVVVDPAYDCNGDGKLQSGERAEIRASIRNIGDAAAIHPDVWLSCVQDILLDCGPNQDWRYPDLIPGGECEWIENPSRHWDVEIPKNIWGSFKADVILSYNGATVPVRIPNAVEIPVEPQAWVGLVPRAYDFGVTEPASPIEISTSVINSGSSPLMVDGILTNQPDGIIVEVLPVLPWGLIGPGASQHVTIKIDASAYQGQVDPPIEVVIQSTACSRPGYDRIVISGLVSETVPFHDIGVTTATTDPNGLDVGGTTIVWTDTRNGNEDIYGFEITGSSAFPIFVGADNQFDPRISGNLVAWTDASHGFPNLDVWARFLPDGQPFQVATSPSKELLVGVDDRFIAFSRETQLYLFDTSTMTESPVPSVDVDLGSWDFGGGFLTWSEGNQIQVYRVSVNGPGTLWPDVHWSSGEGGPSASSSGVVLVNTVGTSYDQVFHWLNGVVRQLTFNDYDDVYPEIGSSSVVLKAEVPPGPYQLKLFDLETNTFSQVTLLDEGYIAHRWRMDDNILAFRVLSAGQTRIYCALLRQPDIAVDVANLSFSNDSPVENDEIEVCVLVRNQTNYEFSDTFNVRLLKDGNPIMSDKSIVGLPARGEHSVCFGPINVGNAGTKEFCIELLVPGLDNPENNAACIILEVIDDDVVGPHITGMDAEENKGNGDGIISDDEDIYISWALLDPSGIASTELRVDGNLIPLDGDYYAIISPLPIGQHQAMITATDADNTPASSDSSFNFLVDGCPDDPDKLEPGLCGCGIPDSDIDSDGDGVPNCIDPCPNDPNKIDPGICGCNLPDSDFRTWYPDVDGDSFGDASAGIQTIDACIQPLGHVDNNVDCDDNDPDVHEENLWYKDQDRDGFGDMNDHNPISGCHAPGDDYASNNTDCNDGDGSTHPGAEEPCDGVDHDCDGQHGVPRTWYPDVDGDGFGDANPQAQTIDACTQPLGHVDNNVDCDDNDPDVHEENLWYKDQDRDGFGDMNDHNPISGCHAPGDDYASNNTDCNDGDGTIANCPYQQVTLRVLFSPVEAAPPDAQIGIVTEGPRNRMETIFAPPSDGFCFTGWSGEGVDGRTDNPLVLTLESDLTITAQYAVNDIDPGLCGTHCGPVGACSMMPFMLIGWKWSRRRRLFRRCQYGLTGEPGAS